jgi:RNA polymerase sigma factor (sigma-70 family)
MKTETNPRHCLATPHSEGEDATLLKRHQNSLSSEQRRLREKAKELAAEFCAGNDHAFSELYDLDVQSLFNYGMKLTQNKELLKDCIHDVFVKVYAKRNEKHTINNLSSYLLISLKNRLLDEFRRNTFMDDSEVECYEYKRASEDVEHDYLDTERELMQTAKVAHLMNHLTRRQRQAITLYYLEERKYDEICGIMKMNYHSVRNLMHRGMLKLREAAM